MKPFTKNYALSIFSLIIVLSFLISSCSLFPGDDWKPEGSSNSKRIVSELLDVQEKFALTEKNKDAEGHRQLFASPTSKLNFFLKNYGNLFLANLSRDEWVGFFTSWDYDYFAVYSETQFYVRDGVAIDRHHFQGHKNGVPDISGSDLFMYIKTSKGWKLLNISSTILNPDDSTDYASLNPSASPNEALSSFQQGVNGRDQAAFESAFLALSSPCLRFKNKIGEYDDSKNSAGAFYAAIPKATEDLKMTLTHIDIDIQDQFVAVSSSDYTVKKNKTIIEKGKMLATLVFAPGQGWKISAIAFSITNH